MKVFPIWEEFVLKDQKEQCLWDLCFSPDGSKLVTVGDNRVWVYDTSTGNLIQNLKGHTGTVVCTAFYKNGTHFATGSLDKHVIIWTSKFEGLLKYSHDDAISCMAFSPTCCTLLSCSKSHIALWAEGQEKLVKKDTDRVMCCGWTIDGECFAVGLYSGVVSIRNKAGDEKMVVDRSSHGPISCLDWCPKPDEMNMLALGDWSQKVSFYKLSNKTIIKERDLGYDPCFVKWFDSKGGQLIIGGSNGKVGLYSKEGVFMHNICKMNAWVWSANKCPKSDYLAVCCQDGTLSYMKVVVMTIHSFYRDRYSFRDGMTDVIIHHLVTDKKVKVKNRDLVKKVSVYNNKLLIQCGEVFNIYESPPDDPLSLQYKPIHKFSMKMDCSMAMICSRNIIFIFDVNVQSYSFDGTKQLDWLLTSPIRYAKLMGGPVGREGLLIGTKDGQVLLIFIDNPFAILLLQTKGLTRCLDLNSDRTKLALVDEHYTCLVYNLKTKELLYQEPNAASVNWNDHFEDMLSFTYNGLLSIKCSNFPIHQQRQQGFVVAFNGSSIYCLHNNSIKLVSVPYSALMYQYLEKKMFLEAYKIACMGVTSGDWLFLGREALESLEVEVAKKCFIRTQDVDYLDLISDIEERMRRGERNRKVLLGDILTMEGRYDEAAVAYKKAGMPSRAVEMYTDLRMFNLAKDFLGEDDTVDKRVLMTKQADWATDTNDLEAAVQMYINAGEMGRAIDIIGQNGWFDMLINLTRKLDKGDRDNLIKSAEYLEKMKQYAYAIEIYQNIGDLSSIIRLQVKTEMWEEAIDIALKHPEHKEEVYYPYALWLAERDQFEEAQQAFQKAGMTDRAEKVLEQLTRNAVMEKRFLDASYYNWCLSMQLINTTNMEENESKKVEIIKKFHQHQRQADIYYAYNTIYKFMEEPFTLYQPESLFNISRYLIHCIMTDVPLGISQVYILYTLVKQSQTLGAYKLARHAYEKFKGLLVPKRFQEVIDIGALKVKSKPFSDSEDLSLMCYYCSSTNPLLNQKGNKCTNCQQPFIFSFIYFETMPVIEFILDEGITDSEAQSLLELEPPTGGNKNLNQNATRGNQMTENEDYENPFAAKIKSFEEGSPRDLSESGGKIVVDRTTLRNLSLTEVIIYQWRPPLKNQYFKVVMQDVPIIKCGSCNRMFIKDDYEELSLQLKRCPFCRNSVDEGC